MKNLWFQQLSGLVKVEVTGKGAERLINQLVRDGIFLSRIERTGGEHLSFYMPAKAVPALRQARRQHRVKIRFTERSGLPFAWKRARNRWGLMAGTLLFILVLTVLSNTVWKVEIVGAKPGTEEKIVRQLKMMGIERGKLQFFLAEPEEVQRKLAEKIDEITWVGVQTDGTTFRVQVVEKERPKADPPLSPRHLVAGKEAIIVEMYVERGQKMVSVNDYVSPGQILVSGLIGNEKEKRAVAAEGTVLGKTWYKTAAEIKMKTEFSVLSGEKMTAHAIKFWDFSLPIWGFQKDRYQQKKVERTEKPFHFLFWKLPVSYIKTTVRETEVHEKTYSVEEARKAGLEMAKKDLLSRLPEGAEIESEKILHEKLENGTFKLTVLFDVIENIAIGRPIHTN